MNYQEATKNAKGIWPEHKPTRPSGVTLTDDGKGVIIAGYDEKVTLILNNDDDLWRVMGMVQNALRKRGKNV